MGIDILYMLDYAYMINSELNKEIIEESRNRDSFYMAILGRGTKTSGICSTPASPFLG